MTSAPKGLSIGPADLQAADVRALIAHHQKTALAANQACEGHALDIKAFEDPALTLIAVREKDELLAVGGLKVLNRSDGELKSMHTVQTARGRGIGQILVEALVKLAGTKKLTNLYLETGTVDYFAPARRLYERCGFEECGPFADYEANIDSYFMKRGI